MNRRGFSLLERHVKRLLDSYTSLSEENRCLMRELSLRESEAGELKEKIKRLEEKRGSVERRVDILIERLNGLIKVV